MLPVCFSAVEGSCVFMWETDGLSVLSCCQRPLLWLVCPGGKVGLCPGLWAHFWCRNRNTAEQNHVIFSKNIDSRCSNKDTTGETPCWALMSWETTNFPWTCLNIADSWGFSTWKMHQDGFRSRVCGKEAVTIWLWLKVAHFNAHLQTADLFQSSRKSRGNYGEAALLWAELRDLCTWCFLKDSRTSDNKFN